MILRWCQHILLQIVNLQHCKRKDSIVGAFLRILHLYLQQRFVARLRVTACLFLETYVKYHSPSRSLQPDDGDMADPSFDPPT